MCISGMGGAMPPQVPASGGATAPAAPAAAAPAAPAATTGVAGAAGAGAATLAGGPPGSLAAVLQQLVTAIQGVVAALGGGAPAGTLAGGPTTGRSFETAARAALSIPLPADLSGGNAIQAMDQIVAQREQRVQQLATALESDRQKFGTVNQLDAQQLTQERTLNTSITNMVTSLRPLAQSIDGAEGKALIDLLQRANSDGRLDVGATARTVMQIRGSASGLPQQFLDSTARASEAIGRFSREQDALQQRLADTSNATGAAPDLTAITQHAAKLTQLNTHVKLVFDSAASNPAQAQAKFDALATQTTIDGALAAIG